ncbi:Mu-like prophage major head subunit gpT family protein [Humitalea sp. 24SJ18S-53]|uniref:Mu-like prophage major head subunit gpT family protein n=1 Tax=Humitalea sp. 24SJ18S-53 TaxID=3422307 RepID=UPI003D67192C
MIVNGANLRTLGIGFNASFANGMGRATPQFSRISTTIPSSTASNEYGWLGQYPRVREWLGDRVINNIQTAGYTIKNKTYENTIGVEREAIEDDNIGIYAPLFQEMGYATACFPDELIWPLLAAGFATNCYDGQYFFDSDHPVLDSTGAVTSVSNTGGGAGTPWFLMDVSRPLKPMIFQERKPFNFVAMDKPDDEQVFTTKKFRYGVDGRANAGFGFWQQAYGSKQTLDAASYKAARAAMMGLKGDYGRPLNIMPNLLVVPPSLEGTAREILLAERNSAGATNVWRNTAELEVVTWLA